MSPPSGSGGLLAAGCSQQSEAAFWTTGYWTAVRVLLLVRVGGFFFFFTALRAGPPFSWGVTSGGPPGGRSLSKDGTRADSANDFCRLVGGVYTQEI